MNQAKRDALHFPKADGTLSALPIGSKNRLLAIKLIGQYCEDEGKPTVNWKQVTRDEFNHFRCYSVNHVVEKLTVHPHFKVDSVSVQTEALAKMVQASINLKPSTSCSCVKEAESIAIISSISWYLLARSQYPNPMSIMLCLRSSKRFFMTSSFKLTKAHFLFPVETKFVILHLVCTMFLGLWRSPLYCLGLWLCLLVRTSRRSPLIALQRC